MTNVFEKIGDGIKKAAEAVGIGVKDGVEFAIVHPAEAAAHGIELLETVIKDSPAAKTAIQGLIQAGGNAAGAIGTAVGDKGIDVPADLTAVTDAESFFTYFKNTFLPAIEKVYEDLKTDVTTATPAASSPAPATT